MRSLHFLLNLILFLITGPIAFIFYVLGMMFDLVSLPLLAIFLFSIPIYLRQNRALDYLRRDQTLRAELNFAWLVMPLAFAMCGLLVFIGIPLIAGIEFVMPNFDFSDTEFWALVSAVINSFLFPLPVLVSRRAYRNIFSSRKRKQLSNNIEIADDRMRISRLGERNRRITQIVQDQQDQYMTSQNPR